MPDYAQRPTTPDEAREGFWPNYNDPPPLSLWWASVILLVSFTVLVGGVGYALWSRL